MDSKEKFIIISVGRCPWCKKAIDLVRNKGHVAEIRPMRWGAELREIQSKHAGWKTVPMVYRVTPEGEVFIGGYSELMEYFKNDQQEKTKETQGSCGETEKSG